VRRPPTDLEILEEIYRRYYPAFTRFEPGDPLRDTKIYMPIDIRAIAERFKIDGDIIHGRLYYHLDQKHSYVRADKTQVVFFRFVQDAPPESRHQVHFPLLASAIASLREQKDQFRWPLVVTAISVLVAVIALFVGGK
jgi:hypothetical protein